MIKIQKNIFIVALLTTILSISLGFFLGYEFKKIKTKELPPKEAANKAVDFINQKLLKGQQPGTSLISVSGESGVYKIELKIGEQKFTSYLTKDAKFLFPQAFDLMPRFTTVPKNEKPEVKLFVMSFCPYGNQAEELMAPVADLLQDKIDLSLAYIVSKDRKGKFQSLHGGQELNQNVRELCLAKYQKDKLWDFVREINKDCSAENADTCWEDVAQNLGIDLNKIKTCQREEGEELLTQQLALIEKEYQVQDSLLHNGRSTDFVTGSPTLVVNGVIYDGERTSEGYKDFICSAFNNPPEECNQKLGSESIKPVEGGCPK